MTLSGLAPGPVPGADLGDVAARLAVLLTGNSGGIQDPGAGTLEFEPTVRLRPLERAAMPPETWAVDGGQAVVADARCLQLLVTRAARVRFRATAPGPGGSKPGGTVDLEEEGDLRAYLVGGGEERSAASSLGLGISADAVIDVNLLRDREEWHAVARCVDDATGPGTVVLVDGDLQPDWRIPSAFLSALLAGAGARGVTLAGIVKRSSLARGGAPLVGQLEIEAGRLFGSRGMWWAPVARTRPDVGAGVQVVVARLDPDAPFAFRIDLPAEVDAGPVLGSLSSLCDDAAFPGYPYPLTVADRLAACPRWLRDDVRFELEEHFDRAGVPLEVRERAFADRHNLMERH